MSSREASERVKTAVIAKALSGCLQPDLIPEGEAKKQANESLIHKALAVSPIPP